MMKLRKLLSVVPLVLLLGGCARPPATGAPEPTPYTVQAPVDQVWNAALAVFTDMNLPILNMDKASGFIRSSEVLIVPYEKINGYSIADLIDCGRDAFISRTSTGKTFFSYTVLLQSHGSTTALRVQGAARNYFQHDDNKADNLRCISKGVLEGLMAERILGRVNGSRGSMR